MEDKREIIRQIVESWMLKCERRGYWDLDELHKKLDNKIFGGEKNG